VRKIGNISYVWKSAQAANLKTEKRDTVLEAVLAASRREDLEARLRADREKIQMKQVLARGGRGGGGAAEGDGGEQTRD
jgi:hypothetical protein